MALPLDIHRLDESILIWIHVFIGIFLISCIIWMTGRALSRPIADLITRRAPRLDRQLADYPVARRRLHRTLGGSIAVGIWYLALANHAGQMLRGVQKGDYIADSGFRFIGLLILTFLETGFGMWFVA